MLKRIFFAICFFSSINLPAQDLAFGRKIVDTLTSSYFWGRGYTNDGMSRAADFIASQFKAYGLEPMAGTSYLQQFKYSVNTFPGKMELNINGKDLVPGKDFIVGEEAKGLKAEGELEKKDSVTFINTKERFIVKLENKLTWSVAQETADYSIVKIDKNAVKNNPVDFKVNFENKLIKKFNAANICAVVKGTVRPDSIILITAHYDHLGGMGKDTYFPGANDNASGISLLLNLAHYYARHPQKYLSGKNRQKWLMKPIKLTGGK